MARLIESLIHSPATVTIRPISDDQATWHKSGKKSRSHTKAFDSKGRGGARDTATDSIIYINTNRITKDHKSYISGVLIHELVHAADLANGTYHGDYRIREKRAVFFQNVWRDTHSKRLRTGYHGRFKTLEYQNAKQYGELQQFVKYYFANDDLP